MTTSYRIFLLITFVFFCWLIVTNDMGNYYADEFGWRIEGGKWKVTDHDLKKAVKWNPRQFHAMSILGERATSYSESIDYLKHSLMNNPANARAMQLLLYRYMEEKKRTNEMRPMVDLVDFFSPASLYAHQLIAYYSELNKNEVEVLKHWDILLSYGKKSYYSVYFPRLKNEDIKNIIPFARKPASWWNDFFIYVCQQKDIDKKLIKRLYQYRVESKNPITVDESKAYFKYLISIGDIEDAKILAYSNDDKGVNNGFIFDGGFEKTASSGLFSWHYRQSRARVVKIFLDSVNGMVGSKALHLSFNRKKRLNFRHVEQTLVLNAGKYLISFRSMSAGLKNKKGLKWRVYCGVNDKKLLGESTSLVGRYKWELRTFSLIVPDNSECSKQVLRLVSASSYAHDQIYFGNIWFDDFSIVKSEY